MSPLIGARSEANNNSNADAAQKHTRWLLPLSWATATDANPGGARVHIRPPPRVKSLIRRLCEWIASIAGLSGALYFYASHVETVPLTNRRHFVGLSPAHESWLGESLFRRLCPLRV